MEANGDGGKAVVTGAGSGIGRALAVALGARGWSVWLVGRRAEPLEQVAAEAPGARVLPADVSDDAGVDAIAAAVGDSLDALVHGAAEFALGTVEESAPDELDRQYRANVRGPYALTRALLPALRAGDGGDVVLLNSTAALAARPGVSQYAASKAALRSLADSLRDEEEAIRVLSVFPGRTATPLQDRIHALEGRAYEPDRLMQPDDVAAMVMAALSLPRTAEVTEVVMRPYARPR